MCSDSFIILSLAHCRFRGVLTAILAVMTATNAVTVTSVPLTGTISLLTVEGAGPLPLVATTTTTVVRGPLHLVGIMMTRGPPLMMTAGQQLTSLIATATTTGPGGKKGATTATRIAAAVVATEAGAKARDGEAQA